MRSLQVIEQELTGVVDGRAVGEFGFEVVIGLACLVKLVKGA